MTSSPLGRIGPVSSSPAPEREVRTLEGFQYPFEDTLHRYRNTARAHSTQVSLFA